MNYNFNTSALESFLDGKIRSAVSDNVFAGRLPSVLKDEWNDMVVIDCELPIIDHGACAVTTVYLYIYSRPFSDGTKNVARMSELERKVCDMIDNNHDEHFVLERSSTRGDFDSDIDWHRNIFEIIVKIF